MCVQCVCVYVLFPGGCEPCCANAVLSRPRQPLVPTTAQTSGGGMWFQEPLVLTSVHAFKGVEPLISPEPWWEAAVEGNGVLVETGGKRARKGSLWCSDGESRWRRSEEKMLRLQKGNCRGWQAVRNNCAHESYTLSSLLSQYRIDTG